MTNKHSLIVARVVQAGGIFTCMTVGGFMLAMFRKDAQRNLLIKSETAENRRNG
jgi:protein SCO1/2